MSRTTPGQVKDILGDNYDGVSPLSPFIEAATDLVDEVVVCASEKSLTISSTRQELIERWLAAHMYQQMDQAYAGRSVNGATTGGNFQGQTAMYLEGTKYGQTAMTLDVTRCLAAIAKGATLNITWLGKPPSEQIDYDQRD